MAKSAFPHGMPIIEEFFNFNVSRDVSPAVIISRAFENMFGTHMKVKNPESMNNEYVAYCEKELIYRSLVDIHHV